jgi:hypothetical protein
MGSTTVYLQGLSFVALPAKLNVVCDRCNRRIKDTELQYVLPHVHFPLFYHGTFLCTQ